MTKGFIRPIKGEDILEESDSLHEEGDKESMDITGQLLPQHNCEGRPWCAEVQLVDEEEEARIQHATISGEAVVMYLEGIGFGEVVHMMPVVKHLSGGEQRFINCYGLNVLNRASEVAPIDVIDKLLDNHEDAIHGSK